MEIQVPHAVPTWEEFVRYLLKYLFLKGRSGDTSSPCCTHLGGVCPLLADYRPEESGRSSESVVLKDAVKQL